MEFQDRLKLVIKRTGLRREEFAELSGKSRTQIFKYLGGEQNPTADFFQGVKTAFPWVNIEWLITGTGEMETPIVAESEAGYQPGCPQITPRLAALLANFEALNEEDKKALERTAFALAQSGAEVKKDAG